MTSSSSSSFNPLSTLWFKLAHLLFLNSPIDKHRSHTQGQVAMTLDTHCQLITDCIRLSSDTTTKETDTNKQAHTFNYTVSESSISWFKLFSEGHILIITVTGKCLTQETVFCFSEQQKLSSQSKASSQHCGLFAQLVLGSGSKRWWRTWQD